MIASTLLFLFFLFSFFCPFPVGCGSEINECCIQSGNDLTVHHIFSSTKKKNAAPRCVGAETDHQSMDHNPSSP
jgi:hypothetical protein